MWVIKIGGSLAGNARLPGWLSLLAEDRARRWLIVPGGGPYADTVREMQGRWRFDDAHAHRMAVQAMGLYGAQLAAMQPALTANVELAALPDGAGGAIWCPGGDAAARLRGLPEDWRVSADSIALWVAQTQAARGLVLLKSAAPATTDQRASALAAAGYVDAFFPALLRARPLPCYWWSAADLPAALPPPETAEAQGIQPD